MTWHIYPPSGEEWEWRSRRLWPPQPPWQSSQTSSLPPAPTVHSAQTGPAVDNGCNEIFLLRNFNISFSLQVSGGQQTRHKGNIQWKAESFCIFFNFYQDNFVRDWTLYIPRLNTSELTSVCEIQSVLTQLYQLTENLKPRHVNLVLVGRIRE